MSNDDGEYFEVEPLNNTIMYGDLQSLFRRIHRIRITNDKSKALITYTDFVDARDAIREMNGYSFDNLNFNVK
jgi:RNA recognition motif-containing protein